MQRQHHMLAQQGALLCWPGDDSGTPHAGGPLALKGATHMPSLPGASRRRSVRPHTWAPRPPPAQMSRAAARRAASPLRSLPALHHNHSLLFLGTKKMSVGIYWAKTALPASEEPKAWWHLEECFNMPRSARKGRKHTLLRLSHSPPSSRTSWTPLLTHPSKKCQPPTHSHSNFGQGHITVHGRASSRRDLHR